MGGPTAFESVEISARDALLAELLGDAETLLAAHELAEAMACYQIAAQLEPLSAKATMGLGLCALEAGFPHAALGHFRRTRELGVHGAEFHGAMGRAHGKTNEWREAEQCFRAAVERDTALPRWHRELCDCLVHLNRDAEALDNARAIAEQYPDDWRSWNDLAAIALYFRHYEQAEEWGLRAAALAPFEAQVHQTRADLCFMRGDAAAAIKARERAVGFGGAVAMSAAPCFPSSTSDAAFPPPVLDRIRDRLRRATTLAPDLPWLAQAASHCAVMQGDLAQAQAMLARLVTARPEDGAVRLDLGLVMLARGGGFEAAPLFDPLQFDKCLLPLLIQRQVGEKKDVGLDFACRRKLLQILWSEGGLTQLARWVRPAAAAANSGNCVLAYLLFAKGDREGGRQAHQAWVGRLGPADMEKSQWSIHPHLILCQMLAALGVKDEADRLWAQFLARPYALLKVIGEAFALLPASGDSEELARVLVREFDRLPAILAGHPVPEQVWEQAILVASFLSGDDDDYDRTCRMALAFHQGRGTKAAIPVRSVPAAPSDARVRVGYVMVDFSHQDLPPEQYALTFHDHRRVNAFVYFFTPETAAHVRPDRPAPPVLADWPGTLRDINRMKADAAAELVASDGIDILVDTVGWWAREIPELFIRRPAPIQVTWLGLGRPGKAGVIDYIVGNEDLFPRYQDERYPEKFVRLGGCYIPPKPLPAHIPATPRRLMGLPDDAFVYLAYHQTMKVSARSLRLWMEILRRTPGSLLLLPRLNIKVIEAAATNAGVDLDRIFYCRWVRTELENISRIGAADVYLDTVPFNSSGLTGYDAIVMGVPRVTLCRRNLYSRFGLVLQNALGMGDLVSFSEADYIDQAVALHDDRDRLRGIRDQMVRIRQDASVMDPTILMRGIEDAWERMAADHRQGLPPRGFDVVLSQTRRAAPPPGG